MGVDDDATLVPNSAMCRRGRCTSLFSTFDVGRRLCGGLGLHAVNAATATARLRHHDNQRFDGSLVSTASLYARHKMLLFLRCDVYVRIGSGVVRTAVMDNTVFTYPLADRYRLPLMWRCRHRLQRRGRNVVVGSGDCRRVSDGFRFRCLSSLPRFGG